MAHTGDSDAMKEAALLIHQARHHNRLAFVLRHLQIAHERRGANGPIAEPAANFVHAVVQRLRLSRASALQNISNCTG